MEYEESLSASDVIIATRAANEGIPVGAISRVVRQPYAVVYEALETALNTGHIGAMPKSDWPPATHTHNRIPTVPRVYNTEDVDFQCRKVFKLTSLEAGFLLVLLRNECATKEQLHRVVEQQRFSRHQVPGSLELTDPKMVDVMICKLRKKLRAVEDSVKITTAWGKGYYLDHDVKKRIFELMGNPDACKSVVERGEDTESVGGPGDDADP